MTKRKDLPMCPYMSSKNYSGNRKPKCSHKHCPKLCLYQNNPKKCDAYKDWDKTRKVDSRAVSDDLNHIGDNTNDY